MNFYVLNHGLLIDGNGQDPIQDGMVTVEGKTTTYAGPSRDFDRDKYMEIDLKGKTVLLSLIDTHLHFSGNLTESNRDRVFEHPVQKTVVAVQQAHGCLESGLTTVGEIFYSRIHIRNMVEAGVMQDPRIIATGRGFHWTVDHGDSHELLLAYNENSHP